MVAVHGSLSASRGKEQCSLRICRCRELHNPYAPWTAAESPFLDRTVFDSRDAPCPTCPHSSSQGLGRQSRDRRRPRRAFPPAGNAKLGPVQEFAPSGGRRPPCRVTAILRKSSTRVKWPPIVFG